MFKKLTVWCLLVLYFGTANGMAINLHYCGKRLAKVQLTTAAIKSCCPGKSEAEDKCCQNRKLHIKISDQHQTASQPQLPEVKVVDLLLLNNLDARFNKHILLNGKQQGIVVHPPPLAVPISIKNCVFRI